MNKLIKISLFGLLFLGVLSVPAFSDNAVKMVTYFPVPYAAYNNVFVSQKFDVGTTTGAFTLNLGNNACNNTTLKAENVNLLNITDNSTLSFANDIYTENALFGDKNATGPVNMKFKDLRINTLNNNSTYAVKDVSANDWTVHGNMYMAEDSFVTTNDAAKLPQCENTVRWKQLKIGGKQGYYLVCGEGETTSNDCPDDYHWAASTTYDCVDRNGTNGWQTDWCDPEEDPTCTQRPHANIYCLGCWDTGGSGIECPNAYIYSGIDIEFVAANGCEEVARRTQQRYNIVAFSDVDAQCCNSERVGAVSFRWRENYGCYAYRCEKW